MRVRKKLALPAGALALLLMTLPAHEGVVYHVYKDPIGIPTYCVGETENPQPGRKYTHRECMDLLASRLQEFHAGVRACARGEMSDTRLAAYISLAYNIGIGGFCKSSIARLHNAGDFLEACNAFLRYKFAGGIVLPGLKRRRTEERALCLKDIK